MDGRLAGRGRVPLKARLEPTVSFTSRSQGFVFELIVVVATSKVTSWPTNSVCVPRERGCANYVAVGLPTDRPSQPAGQPSETALKPA